MPACGGCLSVGGAEHVRSPEIREVPDPLPETEDKVAGFPVTLTFAANVPVVGPEGWFEDTADIEEENVNRTLAADTQNADALDAIRPKSREPR